MQKENLSLIQNDKRRPLNRSEIQALQDFAEFRISYAHLLACLENVLHVEFDGRVRSFDFFFDDSKPPVVCVYKTHLERALERVRNGLMTEDELSRWASIVLLVDAYGFDPKDEDAIVQWLNDLSYGLGAKGNRQADNP